MLNDLYGGRVRVRVGALIFDSADDPTELLLVRHRATDDAEAFWTPPGGGVEFGESLTEALHREVDEEIGAPIEIGELRYTLDFVRPPLHAVSFYFCCRLIGEEISAGSDPELQLDRQLIEDVQFISIDPGAHMCIVPDGLLEQIRRDLRGNTAGRTARYLGTRR